ncbi:LysM peptidoglycan-binding domain-containing protein [Francisella sp. 19X1-34]|uniref:LysM peptidoglycan-binding domain-containing protein n=1 Tax=Francisella sp. 19X1-34 TaxID=3087177 RepID=UPI002E3361A1|nr:LysM peptidoglycan-binding domain-containing protein [Francisella sp. 19X1-34]MED7788191.1 LysM peptidoglycan-binding domain-containing protein [Francisella sp. 19X1-34]
MFKSINKILIAGVALAAIQSAFSMEIYTVKSGDYLYKIAKTHSVKGISNSELTDAIKGINKSEIPGIVDNRIKIGDKLAIPTTKGEVEDGLTLVRNQMIQGSYGQTDKGSTAKPTSSNSTPSSVTSNKLGDNSMLSSKNEEAKSIKTTSVPSTVSQDKIPVLLPGSENSVNSANTPQTYSSNLNSGIDSSSINETASSDDDTSSGGSFLSSLFRLVVYIIILVALFFIAKKLWEGRNSKKELELEIQGKKKRDHLMSRISPVVSDNDFYKSESSPQPTPQEEFDFFDNEQEPSHQQDTLDLDHTEAAFEEESNSLDTESLKKNHHSQKNIAIKTDKGVVFETSSDDVIISNDDNDVEEIDSQEQEEQELQYIDELIEQYLESEKYLEASITIQDALEKNPSNVDLRYKLLEVYAQAGDEIAFEGEVHFIKSKNIVSMFDPLHQKIAKLRDKFFE